MKADPTEFADGLDAECKEKRINPGGMMPRFSAGIRRRTKLPFVEKEGLPVGGAASEHDPQAQFRTGEGPYWTFKERCQAGHQIY